MPRGVEGQYFKAVPEGWLFGAPRPWLTFAPRPTYLVTDAQKDALAARIRLSRYLRLLLAIPLVAATPLWVELVPGLSLFDNTLLVFSLYLFVVHLLEYLMVRRLLAGLPPAGERVTIADMLRQQSAAMSVGSQTMLGGFFGLASVLSLLCLALGLPVDQDLARYVALFAGAFCILWLGMLITKLWGSSRHQSDRSR
ncbi:MAG TPA: hypothetical protein VKY22_23525 [Bradyrhizobium sp.]|nr:hypothetical protein [Bradyrhizobium sp.]